MATTITNNAFPDRVVDLAGGVPGANLVGWAPNGGANQQWTPELVGGNTIYRNVGVPIAFAMINPVPVPVPNDLIGGNAGTSFDQAVVGAPNVVRISIQDPNGKKLYWTLTDHAQGTPIQLLPDNGNDNQVWTLA